ncbi:MAG TPA: acyl-ACP--UDP-N-acetylglucosamine O-acyltransferase [Azospirillaceae bacterium]|nr:acyl-ACP--UDP-N-acetylglucosamine O-acyltransferase [Azospirillaceae bacterium]
MAANIHPSAVVDPAARLADGVEVGPFCVIGPDVELNEGVKLLSHVVVAGRTRIGAGTVVFPFASIGHPPQDLKYKGEPSEVIIGRNNRIREYVTIQPGTAGGGMVTRIGDDCLLMASSHVAHDCIVGNRVVLANCATLAGHVVVGDHAFLGGLSAVHQFCRIGEHAMIGGMSGVENDVIPYGLVMGERARLSGLNLVGLERRGFNREDIRTLRSAYRMLFAPEGTLAERMEEVARAFAENPVVSRVIGFMREESKRAVCLPRSTNGG